MCAEKSDVVMGVFSKVFRRRLRRRVGRAGPKVEKVKPVKRIGERACLQGVSLEFGILRQSGFALFAWQGNPFGKKACADANRVPFAVGKER